MGLNSVAVRLIPHTPDGLTQTPDGLNSVAVRLSSHAGRLKLSRRMAPPTRGAPLQSRGGLSALKSRAGCSSRSARLRLASASAAQAPRGLLGYASLRLDFRSLRFAKIHSLREVGPLALGPPETLTGCPETALDAGMLGRGSAPPSAAGRCLLSQDSFEDLRSSMARCARTSSLWLSERAWRPSVSSLRSQS